MRLRHDSGQTADGILAEDLAQRGFGQRESLDLTIARLNGVAGGEEVPFAVVGRLQDCAARASSPARQSEIRRIEEAILVFEDELAHLFAIAGHQVTDPRGDVHDEVGEGVEAFRQPGRSSSLLPRWHPMTRSFG